MVVSKGTFFKTSGTWYREIYGVCEISLEDTRIIAKCYSEGIPTGESGEIYIKNINKIISAEEFRNEVVKFIESRLEKRRISDAIERLDRKIKEYIRSVNEYQVGDFFPSVSLTHRYEVKEIIDGGMGKIYLCCHQETDNSIAVKTILPEYFPDDEAKNNFIAEATTWTKLGKHPHIVQAIAVKIVNNFPVIFLEMIQKRNNGNILSDYLGKQIFSVEDWVRLSIQFCDGMIHANNKFEEKGRFFVHRDIKPSNIMITSYLDLKITDFGLVKNNPFDRPYGGTLGYMSPEQYQGEETDTRTDIYSFGCVLYEMFCNGKKPFPLEIDDMNLTMKLRENKRQKKHLTDEIKNPKSYLSESLIKNEIDRIIRKCLEKKKKNRFQNFSDLRIELKELYRKLTGKHFVHHHPIGFSLEEIINRGISFSSLGMYPEALSCFDKALRKSLNKPNILDFRGGRPLDVKSFEQAKILNYKGCTLSDSGNYEQAVNCFDEAINQFPKFFKFWRNKGATLEAMGKDREATKCYEIATKLYPQAGNLGLRE